MYTRKIATFAELVANPRPLHSLHSRRVTRQDRASTTLGYAIVVASTTDPRPRFAAHFSLSPLGRALRVASHRPTIVVVLFKTYNKAASPYRSSAAHRFRDAACTRVRACRGAYSSVSGRMFERVAPKAKSMNQQQLQRRHDNDETATTDEGGSAATK